MARLRYNGLTAELGADLLTADTTITFTAALTSAAGAVPTITGTDYIPLAVLDASGSVLEIIHLTAYTTGATTGTVTRAQESTTAGDRASGLTVVNGITVADATEFAAVGGILATTNHNPATLATYTTTSTTAVDVDATNLAVTFTAPASGKVNITLSGLGRVEGTQPYVLWCLRSGSSIVANTAAQVSSLATAANLHFTFLIPVSGLTPGTSYTYKWGWYVAGTSATSTLYAGGVAGPTVMQVAAA